MSIHELEQRTRMQSIAMRKDIARRTGYNDKTRPEVRMPLTFLRGLNQKFGD